MGAYFDQERRTWLYNFRLGGRIYKKRGFATKRDALLGEARRRTELSAAPIIPSGHPTDLEGAARAYLSCIVVAPATRTKYERDLGRFVKTVGAKLALSEVNSTVVNVYRRGRVSQGRKESTANRDLVPVAAMFAHAARKGWCVGNPAAAAEVPRYDEPWRAYQTVSPMERLVAEMVVWSYSREDAVKVALCYHCGVRLRVVLDMEWDRVDLERRVFQFRSKGKDHTHVLSHEAVAVLQRMGPRSSGYVFAHRSETSFRRRWDRARAAIGKPHLRFHDLRVTFARDLVTAGADLDTVRTLLGHTTLAMTMRYVPSSTVAQRDALDRLGTLRRTHMGVWGSANGDG